MYYIHNTIDMSYNTQSRRRIVETAETGYIQRWLVKALGDVMVCYESTTAQTAQSGTHWGPHSIEAG
jgi:hypothetical protein